MQRDSYKEIIEKVLSTALKVEAILETPPVNIKDQNALVRVTYIVNRLQFIKDKLEVDGIA